MAEETHPLKEIVGTSGGYILCMHHVLLVRFRGSEEVHETSHHHLLLLKVVGIGRFGRLVRLVLHQW